MWRAGVYVGLATPGSWMVDDLQHHRAVMVANVLAQVRLRNEDRSTWAATMCNEGG